MTKVKVSFLTQLDHLPAEAYTTVTKSASFFACKRDPFYGLLGV